MLNLCRITSISVNYRDGCVDSDQLKTREREYAIKEMPTFLQFIGYLYNSGCTLAGPFYEYKDYNNFINL